MQGAAISRWTMAYFAASLVFLLAGLTLLGSGFGVPFVAVDAPDTLVVVHLIAVGWLGLLFGGALLQFVPVLAAAELAFPRLAAPALACLAVGLACLVLGFLSMAGHVDIDIRIISVGGALLAAGFACLGTSLVATIVFRKAFSVPSVLVLAGLGALGTTAVSGNLFAGLLSGLADLPHLASRLQTLLPYHAASGLLGWMTVTAVGVSYRLFSMFMLVPEDTGKRKWTWILVLGSLVSLMAALVLATAASGYRAVTSGVAMCGAVVALLFYGHDVWRMFLGRRRKALELNSSAGLVALGYLVLGLAMLAIEHSFDMEVPVGIAAFYVLALGWLSGLGLAQLYKIIPFLTWLEVYGSVMGRVQVPRVQDLVDETHAKSWFVAFYFAVAVGALAILVESGVVLRLASWMQCVSVAGLAIEFVRARRLAYVQENLRLPMGTKRPCLIQATIKE